MTETFNINFQHYSGKDNCIFRCNHSSIITNGSDIIGNHNRIFGNENNVKGNHNTVEGNHNNGGGNHNNVYGSDNNWKGSFNNIYRTSISSGDNNNTTSKSSPVIGKIEGNVFNFTLDSGTFSSIVNSNVSGSASMFGGSAFSIIDNRVCDRNGKEVKPALTIARKYLPLYFDGKQGESFSIELAAYGKMRVGMKTGGSTYNNTMGNGLCMQGPFVFELKETDVLCYIDESNEAFENAAMALATKISSLDQKKAKTRDPASSSNTNIGRAPKRQPDKRNANSDRDNNNNNTEEEDKNKRSATSIIIPDEADTKFDKKGEDEEATCVVCLDNIPQAISSCGHYHYCIACAIKLGKDKTVGHVECVTCRKQITSFIRVFSQ
jgi:hypothetical protein